MDEAETPLKPVQDTLIQLQNGENSPEMFTRNSTNALFKADSSALPWPDCPVIDFSLLSSSSSSPVFAAEELHKLHSALLTWGCFQLINHGIANSLMDEVRELSKGFFTLPEGERMKYLREPNDPYGYGNDTILSHNVPHNWNDRLLLMLLPEDRRKLHFWPQTPQSFREILDEYTMKVQVVNQTLAQAMACSLGLEENSFIDQYGEGLMMTARFNFYPKCTFPDRVHAFRPHSDSSVMTLLLQDKQVEGLQVQKDDKWFKVPIIPHALFINLGDQMEIMSNGIFKSAVHRVVANSERERLSIAMVCYPRPDKEIGPLEKLVNENRPPLYKTVQTYLEIFLRHFPRGERPIEAVKI